MLEVPRAAGLILLCLRGCSLVLQISQVGVFEVKHFVLHRSNLGKAERGLRRVAEHQWRFQLACFFFVAMPKHVVLAGVILCSGYLCAAYRGGVKLPHGRPARGITE